MRTTSAGFADPIAKPDSGERQTHRPSRAAVALAFIDAPEESCRRMGGDPASGSPCDARELDLPGLRSCIVRRFPYPVFYVEREADIDAWRILHAARDIPAWLQELLED